MMRNAMVLGTAMLLACSGDTPTETGDTNPTGTGCTNPLFLDALVPQPDDADVYYRIPRIEVELTVAEDDVTITVADIDGNPVTGEVTSDGPAHVFVPDAPLMPATTYQVSVDYSCEAVIEWTTSDVGMTLETDVTGKVYELGLSGGDWVEPPGVGPALASFAAGVEILVSPTEVGKTISFIGALGTGKDAQDVCSETFDLDGAAFTDPYFELEAKLLPFKVDVIDIDIENLGLSGAFAPDGSSLEGLMLEGTVDTRPIAPLIKGKDENAVCELAYKVAGVTCDECSDGTGPFCLSVRVENMSADEISGISIEARTQKEIDADDARCPDPPV